MGLGGYITIHNLTNVNLVRDEVHKYQMNSWRPPKIIKSKQSLRFYVEYNGNVFHEPQDDAADVTYSCEGFPFSFHIHASVQNSMVPFLDFYYKVYSPKMNMDPYGLTGFKKNGTVNVYITDTSTPFLKPEAPLLYFRPNTKKCKEKHKKSMNCMSKKYVAVPVHLLKDLVKCLGDLSENKGD